MSFALKPTLAFSTITSTKRRKGEKATIFVAVIMFDKKTKKKTSHT